MLYEKPVAEVIHFDSSGIFVNSNNYSFIAIIGDYMGLIECNSVDRFDDYRYECPSVLVLDLLKPGSEPYTLYSLLFACATFVCPY